MSAINAPTIEIPSAEESRRVPWPQRLWEIGVVRRGVLLLVLAVAWEGYARWLGKPLMLPGCIATLEALFQGLVHGELISRILVSLRVLLQAYAIGVTLALVLTAIASTSRIGSEFLQLLNAMFNPLPAIALLPIAMLWFGIGLPSMTFVLVHAILWPMALNTASGFACVSPTLRMVGQNIGLSSGRMVAHIYLPAALPSIIAGLRLSWAFGWRTMIAAELVFGVSSGGGGLGWYIYESKVQLETPSVFAGLLSITLIGMATERLIFDHLESRTIRRWGVHDK